MVELVAVLLRNARKLALQHTLVEAVHVFCSERRHKRAHLITDAAQ